MAPSSRLPRMAAAVLLGLALTSCVQSHPPSTRPTGSAPGLPNPPTSPKVVVSQWKVPKLIYTDQPFGDGDIVWGNMQRDFAAECARAYGEKKLCVQLVRVYQDPVTDGQLPCGFVRTDPPAGTPVERNGRVRIIGRVCPSASPGPKRSPSPGPSSGRPSHPASPSPSPATP